MVRLLLGHGADPSLPEEGAPHGHALWIAVYQQQPEMATLLLEHGANPNASVDSGGSVMLWARRDPDLERLLLQHGARPHEPERPNPLDGLAPEEAVAEAERRLQADPDLVRGKTGILSGPARDGNRPMVELLLKHGVRVEDVSLWARYYYFNTTRSPLSCCSTA